LALEKLEGIYPDIGFPINFQGEIYSKWPTLIIVSLKRNNKNRDVNRIFILGFIGFKFISGALG
jgi:hypothetical protein